MDGFKSRLTDSIRFRLSLWLSTAIVGAAVAAGAFSYVGAFDETNELQDDVLRQVTGLIRQQPGLARSLASSARDADPESNLIVQPLSTRPDERLEGRALSLPGHLANGLHTVVVGATSYRVLVKTLPDGQRIAVSQETRVRDEIARDAALRAVLPLAILVPVLLLIVAHLVRKMFAPVTRLSDEVHARSELQLHALPGRNLPSEIRPFVDAINVLLERVGQAMQSQRRFVADAAHELRSPMTALSLQAERLGAAEMSDEARQRLGTLRQGLERGHNLLEQMLSLARAQSGVAVGPGRVSVQQIYRRVLEDLMPLADAKHMDIGIAEGPDVLVTGNEFELIAIVRNLVDNAVRYTPPGGRIDLRANATDHEVVLEIEDNGAGVAAPERDRILDPFYRVLGTDQRGSGLGLAIVKTVVERMGGRIDLRDSKTYGRGLMVTVAVPGARP
jgi:two-component system, OmpR family, sensor kinase